MRFLLYNREVSKPVCSYCICTLLLLHPYFATIASVLCILPTRHFTLFSFICYSDATSLKTTIYYRIQRDTNKKKAIQVISKSKYNRIHLLILQSEIRLIEILAFFLLLRIMALKQSKEKDTNMQSVKSEINIHSLLAFHPKVLYLQRLI